MSDPTTFEDLLARRRGDGEAEREEAAAERGALRVALGGLLWHAFGRPRQAGTGWWFASGVELRGGGARSRPDLVGVRRRRGDAMPSGPTVSGRPDWVCEIVSTLPAALAQALREGHGERRVPHLWILDAGARTLTVLRWTPSGYVTALAAGAGEIVRAEPFADVAIALDEIFGT